MATITDIVNMGIALVGGDSIEDITDVNDTQTEAILARLFYESARDATLEARDWPFATTRVLLDTPHGTAPICEYDQKFAQPSDCLRILRVSIDGSFKDQVDWVLEETYIFVNADEIYIKYIKQITDVTLYTRSFILAYAAHIGVLVSIPLARNEKVLKNMEALYSVLLEQASIPSAQQGTGPDTTNHSRIISVR